MMSVEYAWIQNITVWAGISAWVVAQVVKLLIYIVMHRRFDPAFLFRLGGMPSSHSAAVAAVAVSAGIREGFGSTLFAVALALALIVMIDAQSVRRAAGQQARLLNQLVDQFFKEHRLSHGKLVEFLGHTPLEVFLGMVLGLLCALLMHGLFPAL